ncbi:ABC transporter ATP-binding protein [Stomatohabitans albus]|uniref:ABC transporter ATP-binding protein n=1 Tax=Stomatohabitans albus TaxID=3110766 RepID=UPI00300C9803
MSLQPVPITVRDFIWRGLTVSPKYAGIAIGGSFLWAVMTVLWARLLGQVTDTIIIPALRTNAVPTRDLIHATLILLGAGLLNGLGVLLRRYGSYVFILKGQAFHRSRVALHYLKLPLAWHRAQPAGDLISRVASDGVTATSALPPMAMSIGMAVMILTTYLYMATIDLAMLAATLIIVPLLLGINRALNRRMQPHAKAAAEAVGTLTGAINESADAALAIKVLGRREEELARIEPLAESVREKRIAMTRIFALYDLVFQGIPYLATFAILALGIVRMRTGLISAGDVIAVAYLLGMITTPLRVLGLFLQELPRSLAGLGRIDAVMAVTDRAVGGHEHSPQPQTQGARIEIDHVTYLHPLADGGDPALTHGIRDVSLTIEPGETIAIVGQTGAGKSTLVHLLAGLLPADTGEIRIDGTPIERLDPADRAEAIGAAFQAPFLFNDSLKANITLGEPVADEQLWHTIEIAQVHRFVADVGMETHVGERGTQLSGGQRQRIALARALLREPRLLILDDATSAVDASVEAAILAGLQDAKASGKHPTTVIVAYRSGSIALADRVVVMADGRIRAIGTHEELLATDPSYEALLRAVEVDDS